jgi:diacylglycerol kinase family enzyme
VAALGGALAAALLTMVAALPKSRASTEEVRDRLEAVVVMGGDGTANEVGNALVGTDVVLAPLPAGSTNVLARTLGLPRTLAKAVPVVSSVLADGSVRPLGVGVANGRRFLFHVGFGFDAEVVAQVERRAKLMRRVGQAVFVYATFSTWLRHFDRASPHFTLRFPDGSEVDDGYYSVCLNTNPYTYLGRRALNLAPEADGARGLAVLTVRTLALPAMLQLFRLAMGEGTDLRRHPQVDFRSELRSLTVVGHRPFPCQVDGDYLGEVEKLSLAHEPRRLKVIKVG